MKVTVGGTVSKLLKDTKIPKMFHAKQTFPREVITAEEIPAVVNRELGQCPAQEGVLPDKCRPEFYQPGNALFQRKKPGDADSEFLSPSPDFYQIKESFIPESCQSGCPLHQTQAPVARREPPHPDICLP